VKWYRKEVSGAQWESACLICAGPGFDPHHHKNEKKKRKERRYRFLDRGTGTGSQSTW
jgi:hypothetical protein